MKSGTEITLEEIKDKSSPTSTDLKFVRESADTILIEKIHNDIKRFLEKKSTKRLEWISVDILKISMKIFKNFQSFLIQKKVDIPCHHQSVTVSQIRLCRHRHLNSHSTQNKTKKSYWINSAIPVIFVTFFLYFFHPIPVT